MGLSLGDYEDIAAAVVWLQMLGLDGSAELKSLLVNPPTSMGDYDPVVRVEPALTVLDARASCALMCGGLPVELCQTLIRPGEAGRVRLVHARYPRLLVKPLVDCAQRGVSCAASWPDPETPLVRHTFTVAANDRYPEYAAVEQARTDPASVSILCADGDGVLDALASPPEQSVIARSSQSDFERHSQRNLRNGLEMDEALRGRLVASSQRVFVEASEASRWRGAGYGGV